MEITGRFLGVSEEGPRLVGLLIQGPGRSLVRWFAPLDAQRAVEWARTFAQGELVVCSVVLEEPEQRMLIEAMHRHGSPLLETPGGALG